MRFALATVALLAVAASRGGCGNGENGYAPCAGKACGETCTVCPPGDPTCFETAVTKACDPGGRCVPAGVAGCPDPACAGKVCGEACTVCTPGDPTCFETAVMKACDYAGRCTSQSPWLCYDPCSGKACGAQCHLCPPGATGCFEPAVLMACYPGGICAPKTPDLACP